MLIVMLYLLACKLEVCFSFRTADNYSPYLHTEPLLQALLEYNCTLSIILLLWNNAFHWHNST